VQWKKFVKFYFFVQLFKLISVPFLITLEIHPNSGPGLAFAVFVQKYDNCNN
jgi:hypothetical protein